MVIHCLVCPYLSQNLSNHHFSTESIEIKNSNLYDEKFISIGYFDMMKIFHLFSNYRKGMTQNKFNIYIRLAIVFVTTPTFEYFDQAHTSIYF